MIALWSSSEHPWCCWVQAVDPKTAISVVQRRAGRWGAASCGQPGSAMLTAREVKLVAETIAIGGCYILISASLIAFNKYLMNAEHFPYAKAMTAMHMMMTSCMSLLLYLCVPSLYPTMGKARENYRTQRGAGVLDQSFSMFFSWKL